LQYADFASWQREWLRGAVFENQSAYWKRRLSGAPPVLELPTDNLRPAVQGHRGARQLFELSKPLSDALVALSQRLDVTPYMLLLAAFKALLHRYSGQTDIVVGCPIAGRGRTEVEGLIGFFLNTLALRTDASGDPAFDEFARRVRDVTLGAYTHQDIPFEKVVEELQPERDLSHTPIFQVMFVFQSFQRVGAELSGLTVEPVRVESGTTMFDLTLSLTQESDNRVSGFFRYNTDLFERATAERIVDDFTALLEGIVADPSRRLSELPLIPEEALAKYYGRGRGARPSNPFREFPPEEIEQSITARFDRQVADAPQRIAVKTRNHAWTYEELNARADHIARAVLDWRALHGATRDARSDENFAQERVALLFEHDAPMIAAMIAALKAGDTYVPLDPLYPKERIRAILSDASAHVLLTGGAHADLARSLAADSALHVIDVDALEESAHAGRVSVPTPPYAVACLLYSSGSTGRPKGTMQSHRHIMHVVSGYTNNLHVSADDRLTLFSSYSHVAAMTDIYASLLNGAALYPFDVKTEGAEPLARWVKEEGITVYHSVPTLYRHFVETLAPSDRFERLRAVVLGGEEVFEKDVELFRRHFPPECVFVNMYGSTETTVNLMYMIGNDGGRVRSPVPVGYPVGSNEVFLLNEAGGRAQVYGEIAVRSPYVAAGYWREPEGVASGGFSPDPEGGGKRVYRTGDFGRRLSDGSLVLLGRKDFQVKIRGFRVELGEIESALGEHPGVKTAVAAALEVGSGEKRIIAYAVPENSDGELTAAGLRDHLKERVPSYMMPAAFMILDSVPLTPNGKVNRKALPEPDWSGLELERGYVAPRSETEQEVARIWGDVLRLERISVNDSFFDLGGHSLLATQLIARLRKAFMMELPLRRLFESPTVAGVAEVIESARREGNGPKVSAPAIVAASREGRRYKKNM
jgi:amino acid adenylation domain-containing protein